MHHIDSDLIDTFDVSDGNVNLFDSLLAQSDFPIKQKNQPSLFSTSFETDQFVTFQPNFAFSLNINTQTIGSSQIVPENNNFEQEATETVVQNLNDEEYQNESPIISLNYQLNLPQQFQNLEISSTQNTLNSTNTIRSETVISEQNQKNDSKNVPKGMMKALAHMVLDKNPQNVQILKKCFQISNKDFEKFKERMKKIRKSSKISISEIRNMLLEQEFGREMRMIGCFFIRKRFINHIFNSKMEKRHIHIKYIKKWLQIFKNPSEFTSLK